MNSQPDETVLSPAHKLFNRPICIKLSTSKTAIEPEIQNWLPTFKPADTARKRTNKEKTGDKTKHVIAPNDRTRSYNALNKKGNLIIRNRRHLIPLNDKFIVKHDYENIIEPSEAISRKTAAPPRTDIPSNIVAQSPAVLLGN